MLLRVLWEGPAVWEGLQLSGLSGSRQLEIWQSIASSMFSSHVPVFDVLCILCVGPYFRDPTLCCLRCNRDDVAVCLFLLGSLWCAPF